MDGREELEPALTKADYDELRRKTADRIIAEGAKQGFDFTDPNVVLNALDGAFHENYPLSTLVHSDATAQSEFVKGYGSEDAPVEMIEKKSRALLALDIVKLANEVMNDTQRETVVVDGEEIVVPED